MTEDGLKEEIFKELTKERRYVNDPSEVPEGYEVQEGPKGGLYYETESSEGEQQEETSTGKGVEDVFHSAESGKKREAVSNHLQENYGVEKVNLPDFESEDFFLDISSQLETLGKSGHLDGITKIKSISEQRVREARDEGKPMIGFYNFGFNTLNFNSMLGETYFEIMDKEADENERVGNDVEWFVTHEIAHFQHNINLQKQDIPPSAIAEASLNVTPDGTFDDENRYYIANEVSEYAAKNPIEFVAEVYSGLCLGNEYPEEIMELYDHYHGPDTWKEYTSREQDEKRKQEEVSEVSLHPFLEAESEAVLQSIEAMEKGSVVKESIVKDLSVGMFAALADETPDPYVAEVDEDYNEIEGETPDGETEEGDVNRKEFEKERRYVDDPSEAPDDVEVQEGPQGGMYYEIGSDEGDTQEEYNTPEINFSGRLSNEEEELILDFVNDSDWSYYLRNVNEVRDTIPEEGGGSLSHAMYHPETDSMVFIPGVFDDIGEDEGVEYQSPEELMAHEIAHAGHFANLEEEGLGRFELKEGFDYLRENADEIREDVSEYAMQDETEFVAEVFTKLARGDDVKPETKEAYELFHGPKPPQELEDSESSEDVDLSEVPDFYDSEINEHVRNFMEQEGIDDLSIPENPDHDDVREAKELWERSKDYLKEIKDEVDDLEEGLQVVSFAANRRDEMRRRRNESHSGGSTEAPDPVEPVSHRELNEWDGNVPNNIPTELEDMYAIAQVSDDYRQFRETVNQSGMMDISDREKNRWGRAFSGDPDYEMADLENMRQEDLRSIQDLDPETASRIQQAREGDGNITMYRAVPEEADDIDVGDYVALNPNYVERHGENVLGGQQDVEWKVLEEEVPLEDVGWPGETADEFVYSPNEYREQWPSTKHFYEDVTDSDTKAVVREAVMRALEKERVYINDESEAPEDVEVQEGPKGGLYYETDSTEEETEEGVEPDLSEAQQQFIERQPEIFSMVAQLNAKFGPKITNGFLRNASRVIDHIDPEVVNQAATLFLSDEDVPDVDVGLKKEIEGRAIANIIQSTTTVKGRRYVNNPSEVPEGYDVQEGPQGGRYYEIGDGSEGTGSDSPDSETEEEDNVVEEEWVEPPENLNTLKEGMKIRATNHDKELQYEGEVDWTTETDNGVLISAWLETGEPASISETNNWTVDAVSTAEPDVTDIDYESDPVDEIIENIPFRGEENKQERIEGYLKDLSHHYKSEDILRETLSNIEDIQTSLAGAHVAFAAGKDKDQATLNLGTGSFRRSVNHEMGHMTADAYGYGISNRAARNTKMNYDPKDDPFLEAEGDWDDYKLRKLEDKDAPEGLDTLIDEVNEAWERMQNSNPEDRDDYIFEDNYSAANTHEAFAQFHEMMQSTTFPGNTDVGWFHQDTHPGLLPAYLEVFEPSDKMKTLLSHLHDKYTDTSPFESDPYPDADIENSASSFSGSTLLKMFTEKEDVTDEVLEIRDYYRVWVKSPDKVPDDQSVLYDREGDPAGNHYYYEIPFESSTRIELNDGKDVDKSLRKVMGDKGRKEYPERIDLVDLNVPDKDLTLVDKAQTHVNEGLPLFGSDLKKSNPSILQNIESSLSLLHIYKMLFEEGETYEAFLNQIQKELGRRGIYSFEKVSKARRYIDNPNEAPSDSQVQEGPQGGLYYETEASEGESETSNTNETSVEGMVDSMSFEEWPEEHMVMGEEEVRYETRQIFERADEEVASHVLSNFNGFRNKTKRAAWRMTENDIIMYPGAEQETVSHELGHATLGTYDFTVNDAGNMFAHFYPGEVPDVEFGAPVIDIARELAEQRLGNNRVPEGETERMEENLADMEERYEGRELERTDMYLKFAGEDKSEIPDSINELQRNINFAWEKQIQAKKSDDMNAEDYTIGKAYSATNAHETMAMTHEVMQGDVADPQAMENLYLRQQELLGAYTNIFEPADIQKAMFNKLHDHYGPNKVWSNEETPYPEAEGVLEE